MSDFVYMVTEAGRARRGPALQMWSFQCDYWKILPERGSETPEFGSLRLIKHLILYSEHDSFVVKDF